MKKNFFNRNSIFVTLYLKKYASLPIPELDFKKCGLERKIMNLYPFFSFLDHCVLVSLEFELYDSKSVWFPIKKTSLYDI